MAKMLQDEDSSTKHLRATRRHQRRCRKTKGAGDFAKSIEPARATLEGKMIAAAKALEAEEDALDDMDVADGGLDDTLVVLSNRAQEFDTANPGANVHKRLFPTGRRSDVTDQNLFEQPDDADQVLKALEGLGKHVLSDLSAPLAKGIADVRSAADAYKAGLRARKLAEADEELAQADLRRAYEANYLDARKALGRKTAERLFPRLTGARRKDNGETPAAP